MKFIIAIFTIVAVSSLDIKAQTPAASTSITTSLGLYVFPAKGQTKETQEADESACYKWAIEQTGIDPLNPPKVQAQAVDTSPDGSAIVGGAKGAAAGAAIGAIAGDAGKGAAIGAVAGGLAGRRSRIAGDQMEQQHNNQAAQAQTAELMNNYKKAFSVCMEGKGYTVK